MKGSEENLIEEETQILVDSTSSPAADGKQPTRGGVNDTYMVEQELTRDNQVHNKFQGGGKMNTRSSSANGAWRSSAKRTVRRTRKGLVRDASPSDGNA